MTTIEQKIQGILRRLDAIEAKLAKGGEIVEMKNTAIVAADMAYKRAMAEIHPRIERLAEQVQYATMDGDLLTAEYRKEVARAYDESHGLIEGGPSEDRVRLFFD